MGKTKIISFIFIFVSFIVGPTYADEGVQYQPDVLPPADESQSPLATATYDPATFELAYKSFIYGGSVNDAYALALGAVKHKPNSIVWRERLAQSALWSNHVDDALEQYIYLIKNANKTQLLPPAIKIATQLRRYDSLIPLLEYKYGQYPDDVGVINDLADAYDKAGLPERAIQLLKQANKKNKQLLFLTHITHIYHGLGDYRNELTTLEHIQHEYGLTAKIALDMAEIYYGRAHVQVALNKLEAVPDQSAIHEQNFWQTKASLAWIVGKSATSRRAYLTLYRLNKIDEEGFQRLLQLQPKYAERQTLQIALAAWRRFHRVDTFVIAAVLAPDLQAWDTLAALYRMPMSADVRRKLETEPDYWNGKALLLQHQGAPQLARLVLLQAVLRHPHNPLLQRLYLNFLQAQLSVFLPAQQPEYFQSALSFWQSRATTNHDWAMTYTRAFMLLDESYKSLRVYQSQRNTPSDVPDWNMRYADVLAGLHYNKSAYLTRLAYWQLLQRDLATRSPYERDFWSAYAGLAFFFAPAKISYPLSVYMASHDTSTSAADALLNWAVDKNNYELTAFLLAYYYPHNSPAYAALQLALMQNDRSKMRTMLTKMTPVLPRKAAVNAAQQLGDIPLAQQLAYEASVRSRDSDSYEQMTELMLKTANQVQMGTEYEQFGPLQGPRALLRAKLFLTDVWYVKPYTSIWDPKTNNKGNLASYTYVEKIAGLTVSRATDRSEFHFDVNEHDALYSSYGAKLSGNYLWTSKLKLGGELGYNRRSLLTAFMLIAGSQDEAIAEIAYELNVRDRITANLELNNYYLQDRTTLGSGGLLTGVFEHKLWLGYPDFTVGLAGSINRFNPTNSLLQRRIFKIFPPDITPIPASLIPKNFWQIIFNFSFGDAIRTHYTHAWRPYATLGVIYDSVAGVGPNIDIGIAGMVFGRDKLAFYYTRSTTTQGTSQSNFLFGAKYDIYF